MSYLLVSLVNGEPRVRDTDLEHALGFPPSDLGHVRFLTIDHGAALRELGALPTDPPRRWHERPACYVNEAQAIYLVVKSGSPDTIKAIRAVVRSFVAHERGGALVDESQATAPNSN